MRIEGKIILKAACGHEVTTEFGSVDYDGVARIARQVAEHLCGVCHDAQRRYRLTKVTIDGGTALPAYIVVGEDWNGWVMPYFTREQLPAYVAWQKAQAEGYRVNVDEAADIVTTQYDDQDPEDWPGEDIVVEGEKVHAYPIGTGCWIWDEVED
jgi:hypothetical protein